MQTNLLNDIITMIKINLKYALPFVFFSMQVSAADLSGNINEINPPIETNSAFEKVPHVAQYGNGDWSQAIGIAKGISLDEAFKIAASNPKITYFFYTNAIQLVLGDVNEDYRVFHRGDAVFFSGKPRWGDAGALADGYIKNPGATQPSVSP
jgi:hypothetical protein